MYCPFCKNPETRVIDSRVSEDGTSIRRRRQCPACERRFSTVESQIVSVVKRSGIHEPFSREKVIEGVRAACRGRAVGEDALRLLAQHVEDSIRAMGVAEIASQEVGLAILEPLIQLDQVAYLRFASVYKGFQSVHDFELEIRKLKEQP